MTRLLHFHFAKDESSITYSSHSVARCFWGKGGRGCRGGAVRFSECGSLYGSLRASSLGGWLWIFGRSHPIPGLQGLKAPVSGLCSLICCSQSSSNSLLVLRASGVLMVDW